MKILYHHRTMARGAEGTHIISIVNGFKKLGHEVSIVAPPGIDTLKVAGGRPIDKSEVKTTGINSFWKLISRNAPQFCFEIFELFYNFYAIVKLYLEVKRQGSIDLIYERNANFLFAGIVVSKLFTIPILIEVNEVVGLKRARSICFKRIAEKIESFVFTNATTLFPVSSNLKKQILSVSPNADVKVIPNAIDPERFSTANAIKVKEKYDTAGKIILGFVGWFDNWDRLDVLIDLQKELMQNNHNTILMLVGDGPVVSELKSKIEHENMGEQVILTGPVPKNEVVDYIAAFDIGLLAHSNEFGSPIVLFEMMALGKCVVAPRLDPIMDVVEDGVNGVIFNPLDTEDLFNKTMWLVQRPEEMKKIGENAKNITYSEHTWDKNAASILSGFH